MFNNCLIEDISPRIRKCPCGKFSEIKKLTDFSITRGDISIPVTKSFPTPQVVRPPNLAGCYISMAK